MDVTSLSKAKQKLLATMLAEYPVVRIFVDARAVNVNVPRNFKRDANLPLDLGYNLPIPIPDLELLERGIFATLSFAGERFRCFIPWEHTRAFVDKASGRGVSWYQSPPEEKKRSHLRLVKGGG